MEVTPSSPWHSTASFSSCRTLYSNSSQVSLPAIVECLVWLVPARSHTGGDVVRLGGGLRCLGQGKMEGCPAALFRLDPYLSPVVFHNPVNDCKS